MANKKQSVERYIDEIIERLDPDRLVSSARQDELIDLADQGYTANAVRMAIREGVIGYLQDEPVPSTGKAEPNGNR